MNISQATQTRNAKSSASDDSLDAFSLVNDSWITDSDADDEAETSDRSKIKPEKLEQAISKAEMELRELHASYEKVKYMKESKKISSPLALKERLKSSIRLKSRPKDGRSVVHTASQANEDSESHSGGPLILQTEGSGKKRKSQNATTSGAKYSSDADISEIEEMKRRESQIQEVIVKVESKIKDMRTILERLIHTKAKQKREKLDKEMMELKKRADDKKGDNLELTNKTLDFKVNLKEKTIKLKDNMQNNNDAVDVTKEKNTMRIAESNINKTKSKEVEFKDKINTKPDVKYKGTPSTTKSLVDEQDRRPKSSISKKKHSAISHSNKGPTTKSRSYTGSTDS